MRLSRGAVSGRTRRVVECMAPGNVATASWATTHQLRHGGGGKRSVVAGSQTGAIIDSVAQLIVRNIEEEVVEALKVRAARHGRSAEAEHRELLRAALLKQPSKSLKEHLLAMPEVGDDADLEPPRSAARRVEF